MRKVIFTTMVSLDGYIEGPNQALDWVIVDEELHRYINDQQRTAGAYLYGRRMYETMAAFWPTADTNPAHPAYIVEFAQIWKAMPKVVFSKTLQEVGENARLVRGDVAAEVAALKAQPGHDLGLGGANLASTFMRLGLIDEYRLFVQPVVLGRGTPLFQALEHPIRLRLVETRVFGSGVVLLRYQCADVAAEQDAPEPEAAITDDLLAGLAKPAQRALAQAGYTRLEQLARVTEAEVAALHGMGPKALERLRAALAARGLSFARPQDTP